jgi:glutamyl-tRNA reductase
LAARHLKEAGVARFVIANRSPEAAARLAALVAGEAIGLADVAARLAEVEIVVGCAQTETPLVTPDMVQPAMSRRGGNPMFFIDLGVPRNVDPRVGRLYNVFCYTIDDLKSVVAQNIERRRQEAVAAGRIIDQEAARFAEWRREQLAVPVIRELSLALETIRREEVEKHRGRFAPSEHEDLDRLTRIIVKRILQAPILKLKEEAKREPGRIVAGVRELFRLGKDDGQNDDPHRDQG